MSLPRTLNRDTDVLSWNMLKAGYSIDASVRNIFILKNKIENNERFLAIHRFLAQLNKQLADDVPGSDRMRYLREYLYHRAITCDPQDMEEIIRQTLHLVAEEPASLFEQFYEEFWQDEELKDVLDERAQLVKSLFHRHLARANRSLAEELAAGERINYLREFFHHIVTDPQVGDLDAVLTLTIRELLAEGLIEDAKDMLITLSSDELLKQHLGVHFPLFAARVHEIVLEG
ncbi:MAG: hypothetical protein NVS2B12_41730 [Ktedonobacteraceae bacterium]